MKRGLLLMIAMLMLAACEKKDNEPEQPIPGKATLTFPAQGSLCTSGAVVSNTQSIITFTWNSVSNADSYDINVKNLITGVGIIQTVTTNQAQIVLLRNTPYSWSVTSKLTNSLTTTQSDVWKFYNAGLGIISYAPFPANILSPTYGQNITASSGTVNITWAGADVDNDIAGYDVYLSTAATPALLKSNLTDMFLNNVPVTSGGTYYWKVITKDALGNISDSGVFTFKVN